MRHNPGRSIPAPAPPPVPAQARQLGLYVRKQQMSNWCWAAIAQAALVFRLAPRILRSIRLFLRWRGQCRLASLYLGQDCCRNPAPCNRPQPLRLVLNRIQVPHAWQPGQIPEAEVKLAIDSGQPLVCRIRWDQHRGHFIAISGYKITPEGLLARVQDPAKDPVVSDILLASLAAGYSVNGTWNETFWLT